MSKPTALTEAQIAEIEWRMKKGWAPKRWEVEPLLAMARELLASRSPQSVAAASVAASPPHNWGNPWSPTTPLRDLCGND